MASIHRELDGAWADCPAEESCELKFHLTDLTVEQAEALPMVPLLALLNVIDPPAITSKYQMWVIPRQEGDKFIRAHRDYDLPAIIWPNSRMEWYQADLAHRGGDKPAIVHEDGTLEWHQRGQLHREDGKPAVIYPDGSVEYWTRGAQMDEEGVPIEYN
jgi:hypothetical protein